MNMRTLVKGNFQIVFLMILMLFVSSCGGGNNQKELDKMPDNSNGVIADGSTTDDAVSGDADQYPSDGSDTGTSGTNDGSEFDKGNTGDGSHFGDGSDPADGSHPADGSNDNDTDDGSDNTDLPVIKPNPDACLVLDYKELNLQPKVNAKLQATYIPLFESDDPNLIWESDRTDIVKVDNDGNLETVSVGTAIITCRNSSGELADRCTVTVKLTWQNFTYDFKADLSEYEWAMNPESDAYVFLVNKDNPIGKDYKASDLVSVRDTRKDGRDAQKLRRIAEEALHALFIEAEANGMLYLNKDYGQVLSVTSGYRSYDQQERNFNNKVNSLMNSNPGMTKAEAEKIAAETINRPGTSEHQTGLCLDMHNLRTAERELAVTFGENQAGKWLAENCYKFGYVLRYEADKTDITGIAYESWHFRYVGRYHATRMYELDMCLEEYTEYLNEMGYEFDLAE